MSKLTKYTSEIYQNFFESNLSNTDTEIYKAIDLELRRQQEHIELIASENIVSKAVLDAQGSIMTNKYAEGYSSRRYYGGCEYVDIAENLAIERVTKLFDCKYANVQPHSGAQANGAVYLALFKSGGQNSRYEFKFRWTFNSWSKSFLYLVNGFNQVIMMLTKKQD